MDTVFIWLTQTLHPLRIVANLPFVRSNNPFLRKKKYADFSSTLTSILFYSLAKNTPINFCKSIFLSLSLHSCCLMHWKSHNLRLSNSFQSTLDDSKIFSPPYLLFIDPMSLPIFFYHQVKKKKASKTCWLDSIPPRVLKECASEFLLVLACLFLLCLSSNNIPSSLKHELFSSPRRIPILLTLVFLL